MKAWISVSIIFGCLCANAEEFASTFVSPEYASEVVPHTAGGYLVHGKNRNPSDSHIVRLKPDGRVDLGFGDRGWVHIVSANYPDISALWMDDILVAEDGAFFVTGSSYCTINNSPARCVLVFSYDERGKIRRGFGENGLLKVVREHSTPFVLGSFLLGETIEYVALGRNLMTRERIIQMSVIDLETEQVVDYVQPYAGKNAGSVVRTDDHFYLAGYYGPLPCEGQCFVHVRKLNRDMTPDLSFADQGEFRMDAGWGNGSVVVSQDGESIYLSYVGLDGWSRIAKIKPDGSLDLSWQDRGHLDVVNNRYILGFSESGDGGLFISRRYDAQTSTGAEIRKYGGDGHLDASFGQGGVRELDVTELDDSCSGITMPNQDKLAFKCSHGLNAEGFTVVQIDL